MLWCHQSQNSLEPRLQLLVKRNISTIVELIAQGLAEACGVAQLDVRKEEMVKSIREHHQPLRVSLMGFRESGFVLTAEVAIAAEEVPNPMLLEAARALNGHHVILQVGYFTLKHQLASDCRCGRVQEQAWFRARAP